MTICRRITAAKIRAIAIVFSALALGAIGLAAPAFAQATPGTAGPVSLGEIFIGPDSVVLKPGAGQYFVDKVREMATAWDAQWGTLAPGQCPAKPTITITVEKGDKFFQSAVVQARRDVLIALLPAGDASKFKVVLDDEGTANNVEIDASVSDHAPPTITVDPPSGKKVKVGDRLTIKATATEPSTGWQAGVKHIHIEDLSRHTNLNYWDNPAPAPRPCGNAGLSKTIQGSYVVPNEPVARLKITARDYHNPQQELTVEYPTTDWHGTIKATLKGNAYNDTADIQYRIDEAPDGTITGRGRVTLTSAPNTAGLCTYTRTITPNRFEVEIVGSREGDNLRLDLSTQGRSTWVFTILCTRGGGSGTGPPAVHPRNALASFHAIIPHIRVRARDGAQNEVPPVTHGEITSGATVTIHRARD